LLKEISSGKSKVDGNKVGDNNSQTTRNYFILMGKGSLFVVKNR
jgi:hypothetical protein